MPSIWILADCLSKPQFFYLLNGDDNTHMTMVLKPDETMQSQAHYKCYVFVQLWQQIRLEK